METLTVRSGKVKFWSQVDFGGINGYLSDPVLPRGWSSFDVLFCVWQNHNKNLNKYIKIWRKISQKLLGYNSELEFWDLRAHGDPLFCYLPNDNIKVKL